MGVREEKPNRGSKNSQESNKRSQYAYAGFSPGIRHTDCEVDTLKQSLEKSEQELGRAKKQLEEKEGKKYLIEICERCNCKSDRINASIVGATTEVATLKQALSEAEKREATERTERDKYEA